MPDPSPLPNRRSVRLPGFDYSRLGQYFVTICAFQKRCLFGRVDGSRVHLNHLGEIVQRCWTEIPAHFPQVTLDAFVVMPNHVHGILAIQTRARRAVPLREIHRPELFRNPVLGSLATIVRSYKSAAAKQVRTMLKQPDYTVWQRSFYESVLRSGKDYANAARYILENPKMWHLDSENPLSPVR